MEIVEIENRWSWGDTINMICEGCGVCHLEFKDDMDSGLTVHPSRRRDWICQMNQSEFCYIYRVKVRYCRFIE